MAYSQLYSLDELIRHETILFFFVMIKFKVLHVNMRCFFESESRNHVYLAQN